MQVSNEKMVVDLSRAEEAMLESRKRKRQIKETKDSRGRAVRAKTNGNAGGRGAGQQSQPPRADALPGSEGQDQHMASPDASSAPAGSEAPEKALQQATAAGAAAGAAPAASTAAATAEAGAPEGKAPAAAEQRSGDGKMFQVLALPTAEARGHTGYLTFARRLVEFTEP